MLANCSQVLQSVDLKLDNERKNEQEKFNVTAKTLTINEAKKQNMSPYIRHVLQTGRGGNASQSRERSNSVRFPQSGEMAQYKIGKGIIFETYRNEYSKDSIKSMASSI